MRGPRFNFIPRQRTIEQIERLKKINKNREYSKEERDKISKRLGFTIYVYDLSGSLITTYSSILRLKKAYDIKLHHKTLYKRIYQGIPYKDYIFSLVPIAKNIFNDINRKSIINEGLKSVTKYKSDSFFSEKTQLKPRKIKLINTANPDLSKTLDSLNSATLYIKNIEGKSDKATIRKYINSDKLYKNC